VNDKWPGYGQDGEDERMQRERRREEQIKADNLSARIRAASPGQRDKIDPATGRTFGDAAARGMYDDASRVGEFRAANERFRRDRERFRWAQARVQGRRGRN
jgi:hypothetical protein